MNSALIQTILVVLVMAGFASLEYFSRRYQETVRATSDDTKLELSIFLALLLIIQPLVLFAMAGLGRWLLPGHAGGLAGLPWWGAWLLLAVCDDLSMYGWHRLSHTRALWPLHRAHHSAVYMSIRIAYRNNFFYFLFMPGIWIGAGLLYLGIDSRIYAAYVVCKMIVILGAHSAWRWDEPLYRHKALRPLMYLLERTVSTPATHWAHHAITDEDGIGHQNGNFGSFLFIWDVIFRTAHITRRYPPSVGLRDDQVHGHERWLAQLLFPVCRSDRQASQLTLQGPARSEAQPRT